MSKRKANAKHFAFGGSVLTVGSLFTGIGGFDLGLERAGMRPAWFCESEEFCRRVLARHWPNVPCYPDVRELHGEQHCPRGGGCPNCAPRVDVMPGGFPCQGLSDAGLRLGLLDPRSGLWSEFARLIGELRPRYVVVENVAALLGRGLGRVLGDLAALGYDAEWDCFRAADFGAPHPRDRIWIVAYPSRDAEARTEPPARTIGERARPSSEPAHVADAEVVSIGAGLRPDESRRERRGRSGDSRGARRAADVEDTTDRGGCSCGAHGATEAGADLGPGRAGRQWLVEPDVGRVADGVPMRVDRLSALGNALVPQIAEWLGRQINEWERLAA